MARAGQHHAHHLLVDTDRCQRVETMIGYAGRQLIQYSAAIPGRRGSSRLRPVVRTATRHRVLMVKLVIRLLVVDAVVHLRGSSGPGWSRSCLLVVTLIDYAVRHLNTVFRLHVSETVRQHVSCSRQRCARFVYRGGRSSDDYPL